MCYNKDKLRKKHNGGKEMKEWKFKKQDLDCTLTINDDAAIKLKINDGASCDMEKLEQGAVYFFGNHHLIINGEEKVIRGLILDNYDEIKTYYDDMKNKINSPYRKKKEKMLDGVQWNVEEYSERGEGGKTKIEEITEMKISVEDEEWNVVKTFDNLKEADDFLHNDERELTLAY